MYNLRSSLRIHPCLQFIVSRCRFVSEFIYQQVLFLTDDVLSYFIESHISESRRLCTCSWTPNSCLWKVTFSLLIKMSWLSKRFQLTWDKTVLEWFIYLSFLIKNILYWSRQRINRLPVSLKKYLVSFLVTHCTRFYSSERILPNLFPIGKSFFTINFSYIRKT